MDINFKKAKGHESNPFVKSLKGKMYIIPKNSTIIAKDQSIVNTNTGEVERGTVLVGRQKIVDKSEFVKVYSDSIGEIFDLDNKARKVFAYGLKKITYQDDFYLNYNKEYTEVGYKSWQSVVEGLKTLIRKEIIAIAYQAYRFWVNPIYACKGERFAKYTEYVQGKGGTYGNSIKSIMQGKGNDEQQEMFEGENMDAEPHKFKE